ncbi:hypothetical protein RND71_003630 [Anisodus tanguticus]|uniref:fructose-bisphosphate aldolase n=1 Tax=Anisodus tanguticus TaxID=243964 RepID=A0AAE1VWT3_9SOLA|nr:hypothetical protein RND71_003630 [Anisodus tanguticus]
MSSTSLLKSYPVVDKSEFVMGQTLRQPSVSVIRCHPISAPSLNVRAASSYADELVKTTKAIASPGRGILAMDESNATCGKRLASIGLENTEANRQAYRTLLVTAPGLGEYISGAILFEETLYQSTVDGRKMVDVLVEQNIVPGIKVDKGLVPLAGSNDESWCEGLDGLASRTAAYYQQGARFAKCIPNGSSALDVKEAAWGLARYAAISQDIGLVPIVEPKILLDGDHGIDRTFEVAQKVWAEVFFYLAENNVMCEGILLKPSMVTPGAECKDRATPEQVVDYTLKLLQRRIPPVVPWNHGNFYLVDNQKLNATFNLNAMNQSPNPWHVSFSYARALQNTCLKTWGGVPENVKAAQDALLIRAKGQLSCSLRATWSPGNNCSTYQGGVKVCVHSTLTRPHGVRFHWEDVETIDRLVADGEASYNKWRHPDPYIVPWAPGGSKFNRNQYRQKGDKFAGSQADRALKEETEAKKIAEQLNKEKISDGNKKERATKSSERLN